MTTTRPPARLSTPSRAYASGKLAQLRGQSAHRAYVVERQLGQVAPEVAAAYAAGRAAAPMAPLPSPAALIASIVAQLAGTP